MSVDWKSIDGRWLFLSILGFVLGGLSIYRATQYASASPIEKTTTAYDASMRMNYHTFAFIRLSKHYTCSYDFMVEGVSYSGDGDCTQLSVDDSIKRKFSDSVRVLPIQNLTVYYDPSNPSLNSLTEFRVRSKVEYRMAIGGIALGIFMNMPLIFLAAYAINRKRGNSRIFVDAKGSLIDPDEIDFGAEFGGQFSGSKREAESFSATNDKAAKAGHFASSHGLRELYLDVVKQVHPDHASNEADRALRERLTKEANAAYRRGDDATLRSVLEKYSSTISATC